MWATVQAYGDQGVIKAAAADPGNMFFTAVEHYVGPWASELMYVLIITSVLASQIAFHNAINRYTFNLARDGPLPSWLAHAHPRFGSPSAAGSAQTVLTLVVVAAFAVAGADPYLDLLLKVNTPGVVGIILLQAITSFAVVAYFHRRRHTVFARWATWSALLRGILLSLAVCVLVAHIDLLTNADFGVNVLLVGTVPVTLLAAGAAALVLKRRRPAVYAAIGGVHPRTATSRLPSRWTTRSGPRCRHERDTLGSRPGGAGRPGPHARPDPADGAGDRDARRTEVVDLGLTTVTPGLVDGHIHPMLG